MPGEVPAANLQERLLDVAESNAMTRLHERIVMPLFTNSRMLPMLNNLLCSMDQAGMSHWFVIAFDDLVCHNIAVDSGHGAEQRTSCISPYRSFEAAAHGSNSAAHDANSTSSLVGQSDAHAVKRAAAYRSRLFNAVMCHRVGWLRLLLATGFNVLHIDSDIVVLRNPLPLFEETALVRPSGHTATYRDSDMVVQSEGVFGNNGGFYYVRANNHTVDLFDALLRRFHSKVSVLNNSMFEDQHCLNDVLRDARKRRKGLKVKAPKLNQTLFPNGLIWSSKLSTKAVAYIVHMNWNKQSKKAKLVEDGLWFLTANDTRCAADFDPREGGCDRRCVALRSGTVCNLGQPCVHQDCSELAASTRKGRPYHPVAFRRAGCSVAHAQAGAGRLRSSSLAMPHAPLATLGVLSAPPNRARRDAIRATWMKTSSPAFIIRFAVGVPQSAPSLLLQREQSANRNDLVLLPNNATDRIWAPLVTLARWLQYATLNDPFRRAAYVAKMDDDVYLHLPEMEVHLRLMLQRAPTSLVYYGAKDGR